MVLLNDRSSCAWSFIDLVCARLEGKGRCNGKGKGDETGSWINVIHGKKIK